MRQAAAIVSVLLAGFGLASADEFFGAIKKIDGNRITVTKFAVIAKGEKPPPPAEVTLTVADSCKVLSKGKLNFETKKLEPGEPVEGGIKNKLFKKATVTARIVTDGDKVTEIAIFNIQPDNEFRAMVKKIDGKNLTFTKLGFGKKEKEETTLIIADNVKVTESKFNKETKKMDVKALEGGLTNEALKKTNVSVLLILDDDNKIGEIRLVAGFALPFPLPKKSNDK